MAGRRETPFRNEKNSNWEGGYRVPCLIRWPGVIKPGTIYNDVFSHEDMLPTLLAAAGEPGIKEKLEGDSGPGTAYKVHLDGYNLLPVFQGRIGSPRKEFFYWTDGGDLSGLRYGRWKIVFQEQRAHGLDVWQDPLVTLRFPKLFSLRTDPMTRRPRSRRLRSLARRSRLRARAGAGIRGPPSGHL